MNITDPIADMLTRIRNASRSKHKTVDVPASNMKKSMIVKQQKPQKFKTREYNRCKLCGRPHAYIRKYGICRICFRELAHKGEIPGVKKPSW